MYEAANSRFERSCEVSKYAFSWSGGSVFSWSIVWQLSSSRELAAFAWCALDFFERCGKAASNSWLESCLDASVAGVEA